MRRYELMIILDPELEERTVAPSLDQFLTVVRQGGGSVEKVDIWGRRRLAFEIARHLAVGGGEVALSSRDASRLATAKAEILSARQDAKVLTIAGDLSTPADQQKMQAALDAAGFSPDVFVCSSGQPGNTRLASLTRAAWEHDLEMMLGHAVFAAQKFVPKMAERGYGRLIFVSSTYAKTPRKSFITSSVARAGLFALSKAIVDEYAGSGVASFVICMGHVDTPLLRNMAMGREFDSPDPSASASDSWLGKYDEWASQIPAGRIGSPAELAKLVTFLISPEADYLCGNVLSFSGGLDRELA